MRYLIISILLILSACNNPQNQSKKASKKEASTTIYLVRHAEKATGENPVLTEAGLQRAEDLATFLKDKELTEIFSTDFRRTQQTAAPTAKQSKLNVGSYNHRKLAEFANEIGKRKGKILVTGHSNTTPELVQHLGGDPGEPIVEAWEYDRLYVVKLKKGKVLSSEILRYGEPCKP